MEPNDGLGSGKPQKSFTPALVTIGLGILGSAIFAWLIQPISVAVWNVLASSSWSYLQHLQDEAILTAARGKRDWVSVELLLIFVLIVFGTLMFAIMAIYASLWNPKVIKRKPFEATTRTRFFLSVLALLEFGAVLSVGCREMFFAATDMQLNASFYQRLDALGPYITDQEERQLRSSWALMENRAQYNQINTKLEDFASTAKIRIPEPLYK